MGIAKWAAVAVTVLMALANLGLVTHDNIGLKILGPVLAVAATVAVAALLTRRSWGAEAVIGVGAVNLAAAIVGAIAGLAGWQVGLVLSGLAIVLTAVYKPTARMAVTP